MISPVAYHLQLPAALARLHGMFHVSLLKSHHGAVPYHADPVVVDITTAEPEYGVKTILHSCKRQHNRHQWVEYLIKWKDYPIHEATWEPTDHLANA